MEFAIPKVTVTEILVLSEYGRRVTAQHQGVELTPPVLSTKVMMHQFLDRASNNLLTRKAKVAP